MNCGCYVEVDCAALRSNLALVRSCTPAGTDVLACVKAEAYGHGMVTCARELLAAGATMLGVARADEAATLRKAGIRSRVLLMGAENLAACEDLARQGVEVAVDSAERIDALAEAARAVGATVAVHLAVNVGMNRFETSPAEARSLAERIVGTPELRWAGVMTHFPVADADTETTRAQLAVYTSVIDNLRSAGLSVPTRHVANSAALLTIPESRLDMVRPGLMLYGMQPRATFVPGLQPVLSWKTTAGALHSVPKGDRVGYGGTFVAARNTVVATLPVGYGDGLPWRSGNRGWVIVRGRKAPVIGRISMDQTTVDVTDVPGVSLGDEVVLIGKQGDRSITAENWAAWASTINYEITTGILPRARRVIINSSGEPTG